MTTTATLTRQGTLSLPLPVWRNLGLDIGKLRDAESPHDSPHDSPLDSLALTIEVRDGGLFLRLATTAPQGPFLARRRLLPAYKTALKAGAFSGGTDSSQILSEDRTTRENALL
jgi:hypothetical protein